MSDITASFHGGNAESAEAYASIEEAKPTVRRKVAAFVRQRGPAGATADEVERGLRLSHQTVSARFTELKRLGTLAPTGERRPTRHGRSAAVLVATDRPECPHGTSCKDCS